MNKKSPVKLSTLKDVFTIWEEAKKSWDDAEPEKKNEHLPPKDAPKTYERPVPTQSNQGQPVNWNTSEWDTLEKKDDWVPGKDKDKDVMQLGNEVTEGMITPDAGTSVSARSLFTGAALQPSNGYGPNNEPDPLASEEIPPGYKKNFDPGLPAPEEGDGFQNQDKSNSIIAPRQFVPRESRTTREGVHKRLAEHISRLEQARRAKLR